MKFLIWALISVGSIFAFAAEKCENYAKFYSIRDYKVRAGVVQGSEGIQYESELISSNGDEHDFQVMIYDNNEDGESWAVRYDVTVKEISSSQKCSLVKIKATDIED